MTLHSIKAGRQLFSASLKNLQFKGTQMKEKLNFTNLSINQYTNLHTKVILFVSLSKNFSFMIFPIIISGIVDRKHKKRKRNLYKRKYLFSCTKGLD